jgi:hypothetical protein
MVAALVLEPNQEHQEGPAIRGESYIKKRNAPAGREIDSVLCLASVELDMPAL